MDLWLAAFGYFACYAPYSALAKALSSPNGGVPGVGAPLDGVAMLPVATVASLLGMTIFLGATGWWRSAGRRNVAGLSLPAPSLYTGLSGLCTALILLTTTLAYTFQGVSIVFVMLLMRGGVLVMAPLIDSLSGRKVRWFSWVALLLSLAALGVAFAERAGYDLTAACGVNVGVYLLGYFVRLQFMSRLAKSTATRDNRRFFVEEQIAATPLALLLLGGLALFGPESLAAPLRFGFGGLDLGAALAWGVLLGVLSQGTGIFGGLILLDGRENTFCVPVNRASSILAGVVASYLLLAFGGHHAPSTMELLGAGLVIAAILVLTLGPRLVRPRTAPGGA